MFVCSFREIYEANMQRSGMLNRFLECVLFFTYLSTVVEAVRFHFAWSGLNFTDFGSIAAYMAPKGDAYTSVRDMMDIIEDMEAAGPEINLTAFARRDLWSGRMIEWCYFEYMVFIFYVLTLLVTIIKSRFMNVGVDSSY